MKAVNPNAKVYASFSEKAHFENNAYKALELLFADHEKKTGITLSLCSRTIWEGNKPYDKWPTNTYKNSIDELGSYTQALEYFENTFRAENQTRAIEVLKSHNKKIKIADLYNDDGFSSALVCLIPDFEYPDFSYLTIGEVLNHIEKSIRIAF